MMMMIMILMIYQGNVASLDEIWNFIIIKLGFQDVGLTFWRRINFFKF